MYITPYDFDTPEGTLGFNGFIAICVYTKKTQDERIDIYSKVSNRILGVEFKHLLIDRCSRWFQELFPNIKYIPSVMLFANGRLISWLDVINEEQFLLDVIKGFEGHDGFMS